MSSEYLFFPFTHMTRDQLDTIQAFFQSFSCLALDSSTQDKMGNKEINYLRPSDAELGLVEQAASQYEGWADMHRGNENNLKALITEAPYFTSETDVASIKSTLLRHSRQVEGGVSDDESAVLQMLLFLKMAQTCDEQNELIDTELGSLDESREKLFNSLRGAGEESDNDLIQEKNVGNQYRLDLGHKMTHERIKAWSGYMQSIGGFTEENQQLIFVTTSNAVFDHIESKCEQCSIALDTGEIKVHENNCKNQKKWQEHLSAILIDAVQEKEAGEQDLLNTGDDCSLRGRIKLGLFSGININNLFNISDARIPVCLVELKR